MRPTLLRLLLAASGAVVSPAALRRQIWGAQPVPAARLQRCIASLPVEFREVLVLRDLEERSSEAIGAAVGVREGTVKSRLFRAREGVRECLKRAMGAA